MADESVKLGIVGCGDIVVSQHLPALNNHTHVTIRAVCDVDAARSERARKIAGSTYHTTDYMEIFNDHDIDAVLICTPPWVTPSITKAALKAGKDVLCEKPMALSLSEAEEVAAVEAESGAFLQVGFTYRHGPLMDALHDWIESGRLGRPLLFRFSVFDEVWDPEGNPEHYDRIYKTMQNGAPCIHDGAHLMDHLTLLTGSAPSLVIASGLSSRKEFPAPNYNYAMIQFANGDQAKIEIGWFYPNLPSDHFQILGPQGFAYLDKVNNEAVLVQGELTERIQLSEDRVRNCFRAQLKKFIACVQSRTTPVPGSREGIASLRLTLAMARSITTGSVISMEDSVRL